MNRTLPFLALLGLTGCVSMAPRYTAPAPPVPKAWPEAAAGAGKAAADIAWREFYLDEGLRKVQEFALANNRDLRIAALTTERAQAAYRIQRAGLLPSVSASASGIKQRVPGSINTTGQSIISEVDTAGLVVSAWELDFFGRVRSLKNQALEQYLATEQARRSAEIALLAQVANAYLALAADRESLAFAQETLTSQTSSFDLVNRRFEAGIASEIDAQRARVSLETARGDVARFRQTAAQDEHALDQIAGAPVPPEWLPRTLGSLAVLADVAPGLPSEVLARRPDILAAENQLKAANANIGAARAAFFPHIALTTSFGSAGNQLSGLFKSGSYAWTFAPSVSLPIFNAGANIAGLKVAKVDRDIALAQYDKAIQAAFRETADALAQRANIDEQVAAQEALTKALEATFRLSNARYTAGVDGYLGVLDAQRALYASRQGLIALRLARYGNRVTLYKVLGGGVNAGKTAS